MTLDSFYIFCHLKMAISVARSSGATESRPLGMMCNTSEKSPRRMRELKEGVPERSTQLLLIRRPPYLAFFQKGTSDRVSLPKRYSLYDFVERRCCASTSDPERQRLCGAGRGGLPEACLCDGCCHTEADRTVRCAGGDLPGLNGHV